MAKNGFANRLQRRLCCRRRGLSGGPGNLPLSWLRPPGRVKPGRIRRRGRFKLYGFTSIRAEEFVASAAQALAALNSHGRLAVISILIHSRTLVKTSCAALLSRPARASCR